MKTKHCFSTGILVSIFFLSSCQSDDSIEPTSNTSRMVQQTQTSAKGKVSKSYAVQIDDLYNAINPFDVYGEELEPLYDELSIAFEDEDLEVSEIDGIVSDILEIHESNLYPSISSSSYTQEEANILNGLFENASPANIVQNSQSVESAIANSSTLSSLQKNRLFSLVSQFKYHLVYMQYFYDNLDKRSFDGCMRDELGDIFNDDNPVDDILFIVGTPESFFGLAAYCLYDSWFL